MIKSCLYTHTSCVHSLQMHVRAMSSSRRQLSPFRLGFEPWRRRAPVGSCAVHPTGPLNTPIIDVGSKRLTDGRAQQRVRDYISYYYYSYTDGMIMKLTSICSASPKKMMLMICSLAKLQFWWIIGPFVSRLTIFPGSKGWAEEVEWCCTSNNERRWSLFNSSELLEETPEPLSGRN